MIVDQVRVEPAWWGRALGPTLVAAALSRLLVSGGVAVMDPAPLDWPVNVVEDPVEQARLRRIAQWLGFRNLDDRIMVCDEVARLEESLEELAQIVGRRR